MVEVVKLCEIEFANTPAAAELHLQITFAFKPIQRLPNRRAAHMQSRSDFAFGETVARQQAEIKYVLFNAQVNRIGQGSFACVCRRWPFCPRQGIFLLRRYAPGASIQCATFPARKARHPPRCDISYAPLVAQASQTKIYTLSPVDALPW